MFATDPRDSPVSAFCAHFRVNKRHAASPRQRPNRYRTARIALRDADFRFGHDVIAAAVRERKMRAS
jgi:hypothetical protein